jgi:regulator of cell morphogenesis and NO signaling
MTILTPETTVGQLVSERPQRARLFDRLGIDYCCGGRTPLGQACAEKGLDVQEVLNELETSEPEAQAPDAAHEGFDPSMTTMCELIDHIVSRHHAYLRWKLPYLETLADEVVAAHGARHPELVEARDTLASLKEELTLHMLKEENILFLMIAQLEEAREAPYFHCGSITNPVRVMEYEHADAGTALARLRGMTGGYTPPADACARYRVFFDGLAELEADLHLHIHEENNILFPRACAAEDALRTAATGAGSR